VTLGPVIPVSGSGSRELVNGWLRRYHYLGALPGWRYAAALRTLDNDLLWEGVVVVGTPASSVLARRGYLEVRRLALRADAPKNAGSYLLGHVKRWARDQGISRLVSYADPSVRGPRNCPGNEHRGTIYLAAGFRPDGLSKDHSRYSPGGSRQGRTGAAYLDGHLGPKLRFIWEAR
jgi:GNAT superfamily N-acetyltransferase